MALIELPCIAFKVLKIKRMERFILWLAKVFNVTVERVVTKEVIKKVETVRYLTNGEIKGDVSIDGNLLINGSLTVTGGITCYKEGGNYECK